MAASPASPEVEHDTRLDELPVADTALEPPYRVLIHNDDVTNSLRQNGCVFYVAATPPAGWPG